MILISNLAQSWHTKGFRTVLTDFLRCVLFCTIFSRLTIFKKAGGLEITSKYFNHAAKHKQKTQRQKDIYQVTYALFVILYFRLQHGGCLERGNHIPFILQGFDNMSHNFCFQ